MVTKSHRIAITEWLASGRSKCLVSVTGVTHNTALLVAVTHLSLMISSRSNCDVAACDHEHLGNVVDKAS